MAENRIQVTIAGENQTAGIFAQVEASLKGLEKTADTAMKALEGLALVEVGRKLLEFGANVVEAEANLAKMSQRTGVAVEDLSALAYAANLSGISTDQLEKGIKKLQVTLSNAGAGDAKAAAALASVGVNAKDAQGKTLGAADALGKIADKFAATKDGSEKAALAVQIFGRAGTELIPMLDKGSAGINELKEEAAKLGIVLSEEDADAAERFEQNMARLQATSRGLMQHFLSGLLPALNQLYASIEGPGKHDFDLMHDAGEKLGAVIKDVALAFETVGITVAIHAPKIAGFAQAVLGLMNQNPTSTAMGITAMFQAADKGVTDQLLLKLQKFRDMLNAPPPKPTTTGGGGGDLTRVPAKTGNEDSLLKAQLKTKLDAEKNAEQESKALRDLEMQSLDALYKHELITVQEYFDQKRKLQVEDAQQAETSAFHETQLINTQIGALDKEITSMKAKGAAAADILKKETEREGLLDQMNGATSKLTVATEKLYVAMGKKPDGGSDPLAEQARQMEIYAAQATQLQGKIDEVYAKLADDIAAVTTAEKNRQITTLQAESQINALNAQARQSVQGMTADYQALAQASGNPKLIDSAEKLRQKYEELGRTINSVRDTAIDSFAKDSEDLLVNMTTDLSHAGDAWKNFAISLLGDLDRIIAKMLVMYFVQKLLGLALGAIGGGAGAGGSGDISSIADGVGSGFDVPFLAGGGDLSAGQLAVVGEKGAEFFRPATSGTVIPMDKMASGDGGGGVSNYFDFRGADPGSENRIMSMMRQVGIIAMNAGVAKTADMKRRGMAFA